MSKIIFDQIYIPTTNNLRGLKIYLPDVLDGTSLPVLYMHDAQNLYDDKTAYAGISWGIKTTLDQLIETRVIPPIMVVGIDNSDQRVFEYSPYKASEFVKKTLYFDLGGQGEAYAKFCVEILKPYIDQNYHTLPDFNHTLMAGSSLGGLITAYIASKYPTTYRHLGIFSLASWFNEKDFLDNLNQADLDTRQSYFITVGNQESSDDDLKDFPSIYIQNSRNYKDLLKDKGIYDIYYQETDDKHNETNWKKAFPTFIRFAMKNR